MKHPTHHQLRLAGWFSVIGAIVTIPLFLLAIIAANSRTHTNELQLLSTLLFLISTGMSCYVLLTFRDYLHRLHKFHSVNRQIHIVVGFSIIAAVLEVLAYMFSGMQDIVSFLLVLSLIPIGVVSVQLGLRLFSVKDTLSGLRNTLSYLFIFSGVCLASLILFLPAIFLGIILDVLLGIVLLRASEA